MVVYISMIFCRQFHFSIKKSLILLGFLICFPSAPSFAADWTTAQIRDLLSDVNTVRINTGSATTILGTIDGVLVDIETAINNINNSSLADVNYYLQSLDTNASSDHQLLVGVSSDLFQMKADVENGFNILSNILSSIDSGISNLSTSSTNSSDLALLDDIYSALTNQLSFAGQTWNCLQNLSTNIDIYASELLATNGIQITTIETCSSNIVSAINSLTNDLSTANSYLNGISRALMQFSSYLSSINQIVGHLDWSVNDARNVYLNKLVQMDQLSAMTGSDPFIGGNSWVPSSLSYYSSLTSSSGINGLFYPLINTEFYGLMNYNAQVRAYKDYWPVISNSWNTITNKSQSIPYTVILPELSTPVGDPNIYSALTNAYLTSYNQQSDNTWFDRVELLLAALVFPDESSTNSVADADTAKSSSEQTAAQFKDQLSQVTSALVNSNPQGEFQYISAHLSTLLSTLKQNLVFRKPEIISVSTLEEPLDVLGERPTDAFVVDTTFGGLSGFIDFLRNLTSLLWVVLFFIFAYKAVLLIFKAYYTFYNFSQAIFRKILG